LAGGPYQVACQERDIQKAVVIGDGRDGKSRDIEEKGRNDYIVQQKTSATLSSCNVVFGIFLQNATFQTKISNMG
jgi:hypothetical protein